MDNDTSYVDMTYIFILQHELIILQGASGQTIQTVTFLAFHIAPINYCITLQSAVVLVTLEVALEKED